MLVTFSPTPWILYSSPIHRWPSPKKRHVGSGRLGLMPAIIKRGNSRCRAANEMTVESKKPNDTLHFCARGRIGLPSSLKSSDRSWDSTTKRSLDGGVNAGAQISESRATVCAAEEEISEHHSVVRYFIRNSLAVQDNKHCCTANKAGNATFRG